MNTGVDLYEIVVDDILLFLDFCNKNNLVLYKLNKMDSNTYRFYSSTLNRYKYKKIGILPIKSIGLLHYIFIGILKPINIIGIFFFIGMFYFSSQLILKVEIHGNNPIMNEIIEDVLISNDVQVFSKALSYIETNKLYDVLKEEFKNDIDYLNVYQSGSVFIIKYTISVGADEEVVDFRNLYATKDGFIKQIDVKSGNILVEENQYVTKGQQLVSNTIVSTSDESKMIPVEGSIYAYTYETIEASVADTMNDDGETFAFLLMKVRNQINGIDKINSENIISFETIENKKVLVVQYIYIEQIAIKE